MYADNAPSPRRRLAGLAMAALACLNLAGLVALGLAVERGRAELAALSDRQAALSLAAATDPGLDTARLTEAVAALERKIDALAAANGQDARSAAALAADVKSLSGRVEALAGKAAAPRDPATAKAANAKSAAKNPTSSPKTGPVPRYDAPPAYGSGYAAWPVY